MKDRRNTVFIFCYICRMKSKLHFGILIILFAFVARYIETPVAPNQQIVVQFLDNDISEYDAKKAIVAIESKLKAIGVTQIKVGQDQEGQLKITYYSNTDVSQIKNNLVSQGDFEFPFNPSEENKENFPHKKEVKDYQLNISEIQKTSDANWDFEGVEVVELNHKSDRFNNLKVNSSGSQIQSTLLSNLVNNAVKLHKTNSVVKDNFSYKFPEVRAGPMA